jgi:hypothetical protein
MIKEALEIWARLTTPILQDSFSIERFANSNVFLAKDKDDCMGLILVNSDIETIDVQLKHFSVSYFTELDNKVSGLKEEKCLVVLADIGVDQELLLRIIISIKEYLSAGFIKGSDFIRILEEVIETFTTIRISKAEVIGLWGELFFLNFLVKNYAVDADAKARLVRSWEGTSSRQVIDFKFLLNDLAIEVKTTSGSKRIHHIGGYHQLMPPLGIQNLYYLSIRIVDSSSGLSCLQLHNSIRENFVELNHLSEFDERVLLRGKKLCQNNLYYFSPLVTIESSLYTSVDIPRPPITKGIINPQWEVNLEDLTPLTSNFTSSIFSKVSNCLTT